MRRIQIHIEEELDEALAGEAARLGMSKAALIRSYVGEKLLPSSQLDALDALVGSVDGDPADVDDVVYGR